MKYWHCPPRNKEQLLQLQRRVPCDGDTSNSSQCAAAGSRKLLAHSILDLLDELHFPQGLSPGEDTAGTCLWQEIFGNSNIVVVLLPALPVPEPWKVRAVPVLQGGVRYVGQHCQEEADYSSSSSHHLTLSMCAWTASPNPARMPNSTPFTPLPRIGLDQPRLLTLWLDCLVFLVLSGSLELTLFLIHRQFGYLSILTKVPTVWTLLYQV